MKEEVEGEEEEGEEVEGEGVEGEEVEGEEVEGAEGMANSRTGDSLRSIYILHPPALLSSPLHSSVLVNRCCYWDPCIY